MLESNLSVEEWKAQKQEQRSAVIKEQQAALEAALSSGQALTEYLVGRGRLGCHITSGNAALILKRLPKARAVMSFEDWSQYGRRVNKGAVGIPQLVRRHGYYSTIKCYDISQTYGNKPYPIPDIQPEQIPIAIDVLREISLVPVVLNEDENQAPGYSPQKDTIYYPSSYSLEDVLRDLPSQIIVSAIHNTLPDKFDEEYMKLSGLAVSVELCGRFGIEPPRNAAELLGKLRAHIPNGEERRELEDIREFSITLGDSVCKAVNLQRGAPESPQMER